MSSLRIEGLQGMRKKHNKCHKKRKKYLISLKLIRFNYIVQYFKTNLMVNGLPSETSLFSKPIKTVIAGALASFLTQPFQVLKTNMINCPSLYFNELHSQIIKNGWRQYMRGGTIAVVRQGYGFTIYTTVIDYLNQTLSSMTQVNKYYRYSIAATTGKTIAMMFEAPLTLLKTRIELVSSNSFRKELSQLVKDPKSNMSKGLSATLARELVYSVLHYNTYRYLKDDFFKEKLQVDSTFIPAFLAGGIAITLSQPLEVIRSRVSVTKDLSMVECGRKIFSEQGWRGYFLGYLPRLCRKPINSGICWTLLEAFKDTKKQE